MTKMKGFYKGFKFFTQIFVVKEREMEIGYPTDVKHVAHIGWDAPGSAPSWMNDFKSPADFPATTIADSRDSNSIDFSNWPSQEYDRSMQQQAVFTDIQPSDAADAPKQQKRKKKAETTSTSQNCLSATTTSSTSTSKPSWQAKSKATKHNETMRKANLQV